MKSLLRVVFQFDPESLPTPRSESDLVEDPRTALYRRLKRRPWVNSEKGGRRLLGVKFKN